MIDYVLFTESRPALAAGTLGRLREAVDAKIRAKGAFRIDKISGLVIA